MFFPSIIFFSFFQTCAMYNLPDELELKLLEANSLDKTLQLNSISRGRILLILVNLESTDVSSLAWSRSWCTYNLCLSKVIVVSTSRDPQRHESINGVDRDFVLLGDQGEYAWSKCTR